MVTKCLSFCPDIVLALVLHSLKIFLFPPSPPPHPYNTVAPLRALTAASPAIAPICPRHSVPAALQVTCVPRLPCPDCEPQEQCLPFRAGAQGAGDRGSHRPQPGRPCSDPVPCSES